MFAPSRQDNARSITRPMLGIAIFMTIAWFTVVAVTIVPVDHTRHATGYGIDELPAVQQLAQR